MEMESTSKETTLVLPYSQYRGKTTVAWRNNNNKCEEVKEESQSDISKMFVKPWEELSFKKNQHVLGYDKGNNFHIPNYSKPIQFVSA